MIAVWLYFALMESSGKCASLGKMPLGIKVTDLNGNRIYTNKDITLILHIKKLLREERYTIEGAKQVLQTWNPEDEEGEQLELLQEVKGTARIQDPRLRDDITEVKSFLEELLVKLK